MGVQDDTLAAHFALDLGGFYRAAANDAGAAGPALGPGHAIDRAQAALGQLGTDLPLQCIVGGAGSVPLVYCSGLLAHDVFIKHLGTLVSSLRFNTEGGDLLGVELKIVPTRKGYQGVLQIAEGGPSEIMVVDVQLRKNNTIRFNIPVSYPFYGGETFEGMVDSKGITGRFTFVGATGDPEELRAVTQVDWYRHLKIIDEYDRTERVKAATTRDIALCVAASHGYQRHDVRAWSVADALVKRQFRLRRHAHSMTTRTITARVRTRSSAPSRADSGSQRPHRRFPRPGNRET
jgi:hypothetical protein